jgi:hypothetical protein
MTAQETLAALPDAEKTEHMRKLLLSLRSEALRTILFEADTRGISVQELLRAVIIPDWVRDNVGRSGRAVLATSSTSSRVTYRSNQSGP